MSCILTKGKQFDSSSINGVYSAHMYQVKQISERFKSGKNVHRIILICRNFFVSYFNISMAYDIVINNQTRLDFGDKS